MDEFEQELNVLLVERADHLDVPPAPIEALVAGGREAARRQRTGRLGLGVAAVAAGSLVIVGAGLASSWQDHSQPPVGSQTTPPASTQQGHTNHGDVRHGPVYPRVADLPHGSPPAVPYYWHGRLHAGGRSVAWHLSFHAISGVRTVSVGDEFGGLFPVSELSGVAQHFLGGSLGFPTVSHDGRYAAYEALDQSAPAGSSEIQLWDLQSRTMIAKRDFVSHAHCCDAPSNPVGIDASGRVYIWDGGRALVWDHRDDTIRRFATPEGGDLVGAWRDGPVFALSGGGFGRSSYGTLDGEGRFQKVGIYLSQDGAWSPDGRLVAFTRPSGHVVFSGVGSQSLSLPMSDDVPGAQHPQLVWESAHTLLIAGIVEDGRQYCLRYDVSSGHEEIAAEFPAGADVVFLSHS